MDAKQRIRIYAAEATDGAFELPYVGKIKAGFASPAADYTAEAIDLNKLIIKNKNYTFIGKVEGNSMVDASLNDEDLVIIDRSMEPRHNDKVLVCGGRDILNTEGHGGFFTEGHGVFGGTLGTIGTFGTMRFFYNNNLKVAPGTY